MIDLSVIIVNYRGWKRLKQCLDSLAAIDQTRFFFEVIIVDNASGDNILQNFQKNYIFKFIENSGNNGFANGCNLGASHAKAEVLLFLNPDTIVTAEAIYGMLSEIHLHKDCLLSCRQIKENGTEEESYGRFLSPLTLTGWLRAINKIFKKTPEDQKFIYPDWISGSVTMIKKADFKTLGGWDEDFWMYYEDVDLCKRARSKGMEIIFLKNITVEHNHGGSSRINPAIMVLTKTEVYISRHVYISKHSKGISTIYMQTFLVLNNLISGLILALLGLIFFFSPKLKTKFMIFGGLIMYYLDALLYSTWTSKRSVHFSDQPLR